MVYTYTPTYYTSLHDSITSICKNILPFSFKKRRLPAIAAAEQRLWKQQSDNLKWQQESFHQILNLMGLCKEGIIQEDEVSAFRTHLLEAILIAPIDHEPAEILRDKLIFLQELFYAKCILEDEYHASKRPLLQRLAVQGAVIGANDVIVGTQNQLPKEGWCVIDLKESEPKKIKDSEIIRTKDCNVSRGSLLGKELVCSTENPFWNDCSVEKQSELKSILMMESLPEEERGNKKVKNDKEKGKLLTKKTSWGFDRFMKWKKSDSEDEVAPLSLVEKSDEANTKAVPKRPDAEKMKKFDSSDDKDLGRNMKEELSRIQTELRAKDPQIRLNDDRVKVHFPANNDDIKKFFPKSWCDQHGEAVLEVVKREYKDHVGNIGGNYRGSNTGDAKLSSKQWTTFDDDEENAHPNVFVVGPSFTKQSRSSLSFNNSSSIDKGFKYNPFFEM